MTAAVECLHAQYPDRYTTGVESSVPAIWDNNPHIRAVSKDPDVRVIRMEYPLVHESNQNAVHFLQGYVEFLGKSLEIPLRLTTNRPHLYLSEQEKNWLPQVQELTKRPTRYWVINAGVKNDYTAKQYPFYQRVVELLLGRVTFVQVGELHHIHSPLRGAINLLGKTDVRQLIRLVHHSEGVLCSTTFLMHIAAALEKPAVVVAGGREPRSWNTYPRQTLLSTLGSLPCCAGGACWRSRTVPLNDGSANDRSLCEYPVFTEPPAPRCMAMIEPEEVVRAIERYYIGGMARR